MLSFWEKSRVWRAFLPNVGTLPRRFFLQILICVANSPTLDILEDFSLPMHMYQSGNFYSSTNPDFGGERNFNEKSPTFGLVQKMKQPQFCCLRKQYSIPPSQQINFQERSETHKRLLGSFWTAERENRKSANVNVTQKHFLKNLGFSDKRNCRVAKITKIPQGVL